MRTLKSWSILAVGLLAGACGGTATPEARSTDPEPAPSTPAEPSAFPAEAPTASAPSDEGSSAHSAPPSSEAAPAPASPRSGGAAPAAKKGADASQSRAEKSSRPIESERERPGLGTTWGETRSSHVSNAPFERASSNPFSLTTVSYNDGAGIAAMMRGSSPVSFVAGGAPEGGFLTVRLLDENGSPLPTFMHSGRTLVQGEHGGRYTIEIQNRSSNRFEAVVTVDGLDVVDGQPGSFSKRGYLVHPFATVEIDGFRQNMDEVAAFRFGSVRGAYASRKGNDRNVGVIGVAFFAERGAPVWTERELVRREGADPFPGRFASPPVAR
jgi:hypothetical protein